MKTLAALAVTALLTGCTSYLDFSKGEETLDPDSTYSFTMPSITSSVSVAPR